jgi:hypothetical protein
MGDTLGEGEGSPIAGDSDEDDAFARSNTLVALPPDSSDGDGLKEDLLEPVVEEAPEDGDGIQE